MTDIDNILLKYDPYYFDIEVLAELKALPDELSIRDIVRLITDDEDKANDLKYNIVNDVINGELIIKNPCIARACIRPRQLTTWFLNASHYDIINNLDYSDAVIDRTMIEITEFHKDDFKKYLDNNDIVLKDCLLFNWFSELDNNQDDIKADGEIELKPVIKNNEVKPLNRVNEWQQAIIDVINDYLKENKVLPNNTQVWQRLLSNPPHGYDITKGTGEKKDCLKMLDNRYLTQKSFNERFKRIMKNSFNTD